MSPTIDHERCSELLGPLVRGQLDASEPALALEHLEACSACREEKAGLEALTSAEVSPMSESERGRIRAALERELEVAARRPSSQAPAPGPPPQRARWARLAPAFGAAILLVAIGGFLYGATRTGGERSEAPPGAATGRSRQSADAEAAAPESARSSLSETASVPRPFFSPHTPSLEAGDLERLGRNAVFVQFARSYTVKDAARLRGPFALELARAAASLGRGGAFEAEARARQVRRCAQNMMERRPSILPAYASFASLDGRRVLVLGFVEASPSGRLDRFLVWAWPVSTCQSPVARHEGEIRD